MQFIASDWAMKWKGTRVEKDHNLNPADHDDIGLYYLFFFLPGVHTWVNPGRAPANVQ